MVTAGRERAGARSRPASALAARLGHLAADLADIAASLDGGHPGQGPFPTASSAISEDVVLAQFFRNRLRERRLRTHVFPRDLFGEPTWDMLMDLFVSEASGVTVSVSSACLAGHVPPTTGLRYLGRLEEAGFLERTCDPKDQRRVNVTLTELAKQALRDWARSIRRLDGERLPLNELHAAKGLRPSSEEAIAD